MQEQLPLTADEKLDLKAIYLEIWQRKYAPQIDIWFEAVCTFLATRENRLNKSDDSTKYTEHE